jgi:hypothetical protein
MTEMLSAVDGCGGFPAFPSRALGSESVNPPQRSILRPLQGTPTTDSALHMDRAAIERMFRSPNALVGRTTQSGHRSGP